MNLINTTRFENGKLTTVWEQFDCLSEKAKRAILIAKDAINNNRLIDNRIEEIEEKTNREFIITELPMGSGGVGQLKIMQSEIRFQIGYGHGRNNYAQTLVIPK